jgi:hypothetical protein
LNIIVKQSTPRVDPKRPESHPGYEKALRVSKKLAKKMEFETEGAKRDYYRALEKNPANLPGMPMFYPPLETKFVMEFDKREYTDDEVAKVIRERIRQMTIRSVDIWCEPCRKVTEHSIDMLGSFCKTCGSLKNFHH